jgi:coenzyme F420-reducing hydrogenase gamma subunit
MSAPTRRVAVVKFASCDGCQLTLLDCEDELLAIAGAVDIVHFLEAGGPVLSGPYDLAIVEGSITTAHDAARIRELREQAKVLVSIGACATAGGVQALRNVADVEEYASVVYAHPEFLKTLATSTPISSHVQVDVELRGCPVDKGQLLHVISSYLLGRPPRLDSSPVCVECKRRGTPCVLVVHGTPCLGPVTHGGCGALCPAFDRGCFGCFGPADTVNAHSLVRRLRVGTSSKDITRMFHTFTTEAPGFRGVVADESTEATT